MKRIFRTDPITAEVVGGALSGAADEMGELLTRAAYSDNIKERRDSSTAIFDAAGRVIAQAAHIPIHLGSIVGVMGATVARYSGSEIRPGDVFIGNDPHAAGGTHLNDIVLLAPVFDTHQVIAWVANLGHHADFFDRGEGRHIWQEGLRLPAVKLIREGTVARDVWQLVLLNCQLPNERAGDLRAQIAANELGARRLVELYSRLGGRKFSAVVEDLCDATERSVREAVSRLPDGTYEFADKLDSAFLVTPAELQIKVHKKGDRLTFDFAGCPPQGPHPLNMNWTALYATCTYAIKTLFGPNLPANDGLYRCVEIEAPTGTIVNCREPAAVDGRVQTCQRVVDLIYGALAPVLPATITAAHNGACSEMGFFSSGDVTPPFRYIESIGGGLGARHNKDGLDGVQAHMTNTTNLPIEVLETAYPLTVRRYELVPDSGGPGMWRGGLGVVREIQVESDGVFGNADITRAEVPPWGLNGGKPGGKQVMELVRLDGSAERLGYRPTGHMKVSLREGERLRVVTSGGGGYGDPYRRDRRHIAADLRDGKISAASAAEVYGYLPGAHRMERQ